MGSPIRSCPFTSSGSKRSRAFTLVEVIVVVAVVLILMALITSSLYMGSRGIARTRARVVQKQEIMKHFHQMRRQLINLHQPEKGASLLGVKGVADKEDEIYFVTTSLNRYQSAGEAGYKIDRNDSGRPWLVYTEFPFPRSDPRRFADENPTDRWWNSSNVIRGLTLEYQSSNQWYDQWKKDDPPDKIKVTFWYLEEDPERDKNETPEMKPFTFIVVPGIKSVF